MVKITDSEKTFNNEIFYRRSRYRLKKDAQKGAINCRKVGYKARVVREDGLWVLYIR